MKLVVDAYTDDEEVNRQIREAIGDDPIRAAEWVIFAGQMLLKKASRAAGVREHYDQRARAKRVARDRLSK